LSDGDGGRSGREITAEAVIDFLHRHPGFFEEHPGLLADLRIPHARGSSVSLVERQVSVLRAQNEQHRTRLHELIDIARHNEELAGRMHRLVLRLMDSAEPADIFAVLYNDLRENFSADRIAVRLFADPAFVDKAAGEEFAGQDANEKALFRSIIDRRRPFTGRLKRQQQVFLFGDDGDDVASAVMMPLRGPGWGGILAIGSTDAARFKEGMSVELLTNLGEVLSYILKPWVREP
jgi:uncharacterized protein YigA (DUF484 family)